MWLSFSPHSHNYYYITKWQKSKGESNQEGDIPVTLYITTTVLSREHKCKIVIINIRTLFQARLCAVRARKLSWCSQLR